MSPFRCNTNSKYCFSDTQTCDLVDDCGDNTDETSCKNIRCNFDSDTCQWKNVKGEDDFDWTRHTGSTGSIGTGPHTDHTTGSGKFLRKFNCVFHTFQLFYNILPSFHRKISMYNLLIHT